MTDRELFIIIAEDDVDDTYIIRKSFEKHPAFTKVVSVRNGKELLQHLKADQNQMPHVILSDVSMPVLNGVEALQNIAGDSRLASIPVFMYSSSSHVIHRKKCEELGVRDFFLKPFDLAEFDEIPNKVLESLNHREQRN